jgi:hypothetical protein
MLTTYNIGVSFGGNFNHITFCVLQAKHRLPLQAAEFESLPLEGKVAGFRLTDEV